jgi:hypothetical protein
MSGGPGNIDQTISEEDFSKGIDNLPKGVKLKLSGGEIFTLPRIYNYLDIVKHSGKKIRLFLQTNGFWGKDSKINSYFERLEDYDITSFDISSSDKWHMEQGYKLEWGENIIKRASKLSILAKQRGCWSTPTPVGRAKPSSLEGYTHAGNCETACRNENPDITIDWRGQTSLCCYGFFKMKGNITKQSLSKIFRDSEKDPLIKTLRRRGIDKVAELCGMSDREINTKQNWLGRRSFCAYLFNEGIIDKKYRTDFGE